MGLLLAIFLGSCGAAIVTEHTYGDDVFAPVGATTITTEDVPDGVDVFAPQPAASAADLAVENAVLRAENAALKRMGRGCDTRWQWLLDVQITDDAPGRAGPQHHRRRGRRRGRLRPPAHRRPTTSWTASPAARARQVHRIIIQTCL